ncbi:hypothetical protein M404DRAFT_32873 [Pisolithus tinctorius Marx 270]|uniref:Uncharacterized protein n=1 Tax=Pisolithus tinctorius Marx 270 TaxID=870435 RepID=A0A0C3N712_PISTI|nr:hypothetical protein M404DRAFT_32873 [Pisolithus tinctorius Marx 270]
MIPPATKYDIPAPGHQELGNDSDSLGQECESPGLEFVGPAGRTYHNFHPGLNTRRCDASGQYLLDDAPPPLPAERSSDDWSPFQNQLEFKLVDFLFRQAEMPAKKIDMLLEIWAVSLLALCGEPLFTNQKDLYCIIDSTSIGEVKWESFVVQYTDNGRDGQDSNMVPWMLDSYDVWYRDPHKVIHNVLACTDLIGRINYIPYWEYDSTNNRRRWEDFMSGAWAWNEADRIISEDPMTAGVTLIPIILGSDKTMESLDDDALHHHREHADAVIEEFDFHKLWDMYGIVGNIVLFTNDFLRADIYGMLSPDILHQLIKGGFKDHLVDWVEHYLSHIHGKTQVEKVLDEIDWRITAVAPYTGLQCFPQGQHFKQWTGNDSKGLMKQLKVMFHNMSSSLFEPFWNFVTLRFHLYHEVFRNAGVVDTFSLPWQHAMKHYYHLICQFSTPNGLCSSITESKHIKAIKWPYWHTNHFQALGQMLLINQRLDKPIAVCTDFKEHGMLNELLLSHALGALGQHSNDADDLCDQVGESCDMADEIEEQTGSYEEELGNAIDALRSVEAHMLTGLNILEASQHSAPLPLLAILSH